MDFFTPTLTVVEHLAGPATVTAFVQLLKNRNRVRLNIILDKIVASEVLKIQASKGKETPTIYEISLRISAKTKGSRFEDEALTKVGEILIRMYDQISDIPSFPKKHEVLKQLTTQIKLWFDNTPPPPSKFLFFFKRKQKILTAKQVNLLQPNGNSKKFLSKLVSYKDTPGHVDLTVEGNGLMLKKSKTLNSSPKEEKVESGVVISGPIPLPFISAKELFSIKDRLLILKDELSHFKEKINGVDKDFERSKSIYNDHYKFKVESFSKYLFYQKMMATVLLALFFVSAWFIIEYRYLILSLTVLLFPIVLLLWNCYYIVKRQRAKKRINMMVKLQLVLNKYEVQNHELIYNDLNLLHFKDRRKYLDYTSVVCIKHNSLIINIFSILEKKALFRDLKKGSVIFVNGYIAKKVILMQNRNLLVKDFTGIIY